MQVHNEAHNKAHVISIYSITIQRLPERMNDYAILYCLDTSLSLPQLTR